MSLSDYHTIIKRATEVLRNGGVILYPTDTIWGLGCDATNSSAVRRVYEIKERADSKSMLILMSNINDLSRYVMEVPEIAWELIEASDKPLTIIYPDAKNLASELLAEDKSVGIRITEDEFCSDLIDRFRKPVVSTSANRSGANPPANYSEIEERVKEAVDYIVPLRQEETEKQIASSILKLEIDGRFKILR